MRLNKRAQEFVHGVFRRAIAEQTEIVVTAPTRRAAQAMFDAVNPHVSSVVLSTNERRFSWELPNRGRVTIEIVGPRVPEPTTSAEREKERA